MRILIDGDVLRYRAGFTAERMRYRLVDRHSDDNVITLSSTKMGEVKKEIADKDKSEWRLEKYKEVDPVEFALQNCKKIINHIIKSCHAQYGIEGHETVGIYLTAAGDHNFRCKVATTQPYKGNRMFRYEVDGSRGPSFYLKAKSIGEAYQELFEVYGMYADQVKKQWLKIPPGRPVHYDALTEYLLEHWGAIEVVGSEVDDKLATSLAKSKDSVCCSIDKDLLQVPGNHFNFVTNEFTYVRPEPDYAGYLTAINGKFFGTGFIWFCAQMLLGDSADHIQGLYGYGPAKVYKVLNLGTYAGPLSNEHRLIKIVQKEYIKFYADKEVAKQRFFENAQLLWLKRSEDDDICLRLKNMLSIK